MYDNEAHSVVTAGVVPDLQVGSLGVDCVQHTTTYYNIKLIICTIQIEIRYQEFTLLILLLL